MQWKLLLLASVSAVSMHMEEERERESFDWTQTLVSGSAVLDRVAYSQGQCGSCAAFTTMDVVKSAFRLRYERDVNDMSVAQIISCAALSCDSRFPYRLFLEWLGRHGALSARSVAGYDARYQRGKKIPSCAAASSPNEGWPDREEAIPPFEFRLVGPAWQPNRRLFDEEVKRLLVAHGPLLAAIRMPDKTEILCTWFKQKTPPGMVPFNNGIITSDLIERCFGEERGKNRHAVVLSGWGHEATLPFWRAKNSWGTTWGEGGFFRVQRWKDAMGLMSTSDVRAVVVEASRWDTPPSSAFLPPLSSLQLHEDGARLLREGGAPCAIGGRGCGPGHTQLL